MPPISHSRRAGPTCTDFDAAKALSRHTDCPNCAFTSLGGRWPHVATAASADGAAEHHPNPRNALKQLTGERPSLGLQLRRSITAGPTDRATTDRINRDVSAPSSACSSESRKQRLENINGTIMRSPQRTRPARHTVGGRSSVLIAGSFRERISAPRGGQRRSGTPT